MKIFNKENFSFSFENLCILEDFWRIFELTKNLRILLQSIFRNPRIFVFVFGPFSIFVEKSCQQLWFQAWKRRKNYDPMKAAGNRPSSSKEATRKVSSSSSRNYSKQQTESVKESPRHKKIIELTSREMTKSLIMEDTCSDSQMQRSNSFHCNAKVNITIGSIKKRDN